MKNEAAKKLIVSLGVVFLFLIVSYGITSYSSTLTHSTECGDLDSYCYRYMGMVIAKGAVPYRDAFDNKGPLIYVLNCIGYLINRKFGVFLVEYVFMTLFLFVQYSIARRFVDVKRSVIYTIAANGPMGAFFLGNMTEEYALLFLSMGLLVYIDYFLFDKREWYRIFICGLSCGAVMMLRPNMIAVWIVFCFYAVFIDIRNKKGFPVKTALLFLLGIFAVVIPFIIWLGAYGAIGDFWNAYIMTNISYSTESNSAANIFGSFMSYLLASLSEIYIILLLVCVLKKERIGFNVVYLIYMIANILTISLSGKGFEHYGMITLPALIYPLASSSDLIKCCLKKKKYLYDLVSLLSSVLLIGFIVNNFFTTVPALICGDVEVARNERILSVIENTEPDTKILVLGYKDYYYVESDRMASSRFHYVTSMMEGYPEGIEGVTEDMNRSSPELVIIVEGFDYEYLNFDFSNYHLADEELNIWMRNTESERSE